MRIPFDPPYTKDDVEQMDIMHYAIGVGDLWEASQTRRELLETDDVQEVTND